MIRKGKRRNALWSPRYDPFRHNWHVARSRALDKAIRRHDRDAMLRIAFDSYASAMERASEAFAAFRDVGVAASEAADTFRVAFATAPAAGDVAVAAELAEPYRLTPVHDI